jgi:uncharacterized membrane protein
MKRPSVLFFCLSVSLLFNTFFIGLLVSHAFPVMGGHFNHSFAAEERLEHAVTALDPPYQDKVQALLAAHEKETKAGFERMHHLFRQIEETLTAPKFDAGKLSGIRQRIDDEDKQLKTSFTGIIDQIAATLPDEQRIAFFSKALPQPKSSGHKPENVKNPSK